MKISARQLQKLMVIVYDSLCLDGVPFSITRPDRQRLYNEIMNQQNTEIVDTDPKEETQCTE
jgi:hypothetical protein